jgi:hypothetical protein
VSRHFESAAHVAADAVAVFDWVDDQTRLAQHMGERSAMMGGGRMTYDFDEGRGRAVGSHIRMGGEAFGLHLFVDEVVTERERPRRKAWKTVGEPKLLIIEGYEMGFEIDPEPGGARLRVWIDYDLPHTALGATAGPALGAKYARWCVDQMVSDAVEHFDRPPAAARFSPA